LIANCHLRPQRHPPMDTVYPRNSHASIPTVDPAFAASGERFLALIASTVALPADSTHSELERHLVRESRDLMRQVMQDQLDRQAASEAQESPTGVDAEIATRRSTARDLRAVFGDVQVRRLTWKEPGKTGLRPLDAVLNVPPGLYSHYVAEQLGVEVAKGSFDEAVASLLARGMSVPKRQAEELTVSYAAHFDAFYTTERGKAAPTSSAHLVMSLDGKGIAMRKEDLRPETKKKAEKKGQRTRSRLGPGEKSNQKRMSEVAAIWWQEPAVRGPEDIVGDLDGVKRKDRPQLPRPVGKRVWASVERGIPAVVAEVFREAELRDPKHAHVWVALLDGDPDQVDAVKREAKRRKVEIHLVLDLIHASEYLWKAASALHPTDTAGREAADRWVDRYLLDLLRGASGAVASSLSNKATKGQMSETARKELRNAARYLRNHRDMLRYDRALALGFPIATGVIEGACRYLVKDRMGITGARWRLQRAEAVLRLRAIRASGDWDAYVRFYEQREFANNHAWYARSAKLEAA